jgi:hypothetical protein
LSTSRARAYILALSLGVRHRDERERAADLLMVAAESKRRSISSKRRFSLNVRYFFTAF